MNIRVLSAALYAISLNSYATTFDIRTGDWEVTAATKLSGMPVPQQALNEMSPAQRAKIEQMMQARAGKVNTNTYHTCITRQDLDRSELVKSDDPGCTQTVTALSARHLEVEEVCSGSLSRKTHLKLDSKSPDSFTANIDRTTGNGQVQSILTGKWVAAACRKGDSN